MPVLDNLVDAQVRATEYPATFQAPSQRKLATLRANDRVTISRNGEMFWIELFHVDGTTLYGHVGSHLTKNPDLPMGSAVTVEPRHVFQIIEARHVRPG
jgi:hypothetical protein